MQNSGYFVWDERKRQANIKKHGVDFADVTGIFYDDDTIIIEDPELHDEQRYIALGLDVKSRVVVVVHVYRDVDVIRIISARKADPKERSQFAGGT
ncbi:MAG: BrnT family toxin [Candidatus Thiothrix moscowensis]|nr:BrnT family toxin [Candidatus Thiothrix moscowensis]